MFEMNSMTRLQVLLGLLTSGSGSSEHRHISRVHFVYFKPGRLVLGSSSSSSSSSSSNVVDSSNNFLVRDSDIAERLTFDLSTDSPASRLTTAAEVHTSGGGGGGGSGSGKVCVRFEGEAGGHWPTPQRGHWFPHVDDTSSFRYRDHATPQATRHSVVSLPFAVMLKCCVWCRSKVDHLCRPVAASAPLASSASSSHSFKKRKVLIYQRDRSRCTIACLPACY